MKKLFLAAVAALAMAGSAQAATFDANMNVTATPFRTSDNTAGLQTRAWILSGSGPQNFNGASYRFTVNEGFTTTVDLYRLVTFDAPLEDDDFDVEDPTSMVLDFGLGFTPITLQGLSGAVRGTAYALATFESASFRVGPALKLVIDIQDTVFGTDGTNFRDGGAGAGVVRANFTLAAIPVPAGGILLIGALAGLAALRRRKMA